MLYTMIIIAVFTQNGLTATNSVRIEGFQTKQECEVVLNYMKTSLGGEGEITTAECVPGAEA